MKEKEKKSEGRDVFCCWSSEVEDPSLSTVVRSSQWYGKAIVNSVYGQGQVMISDGCYIGKQDAWWAVNAALMRMIFLCSYLHSFAPLSWFFVALGDFRNPATCGASFSNPEPASSQHPSSSHTKNLFTSKKSPSSLPSASSLKRARARSSCTFLSLIAFPNPQFALS